MINNIAIASDHAGYKLKQYLMILFYGKIAYSHA